MIVDPFGHKRREALRQMLFESDIKAEAHRIAIDISAHLNRPRIAPHYVSFANVAPYTRFRPN